MSVGVDHYENFPVASWLCPKHLRPAVQAIYRWARTGDDIADEGTDTPSQRLNQLASMRNALQQAIAEQAHDATTQPWAQLVAPLAQLVRNGLKPKPLFDLLQAFESDVSRTASAPLGDRYQDWPALLNYCSYSANPVGRLMLQLYKVNDPEVMAQSDAVCTAATD
ncbi:squalene/phytoene synthase family protein [Comamonadaceae bacterium M7527]|nr:squalene/phytoene synthase family protein [Comamonadaceae bacterium M7527]